MEEEEKDEINDAPDARVYSIRLLRAPYTIGYACTIIDCAIMVFAQFAFKNIT